MQNINQKLKIMKISFKKHLKHKNIIMENQAK